MWILRIFFFGDVFGDDVADEIGRRGRGCFFVFQTHKMLVQRNKGLGGCPIASQQCRSEVDYSMSAIETIICLILLLMAVPDVCRKLGRPALANVCFVVFGLALGPVVKTDVATMVKEAGEVGFLLVLFEVGLEINLPKLRELVPSLRFAAIWLLVQYPLVLALAHASGLNLPEGLWRRRR